MGGRGASSGMTGRSTGFSYKQGNRTVTVQRTAGGRLLWMECQERLILIHCVRV